MCIKYFIDWMLDHKNLKTTAIEACWHPQGITFQASWLCVRHYSTHFTGIDWHTFSLQSPYEMSMIISILILWMKKFNMENQITWPRAGLVCGWFRIELMRPLASPLLCTGLRVIYSHGIATGGLKEEKYHVVPLINIS